MQNEKKYHDANCFDPASDQNVLLIRLDFFSHNFKQLTVFSKTSLVNREEKYRCKNEKKYHDANCFDPASDQNVNE